jgi:hypothetical protein
VRATLCDREIYDRTPRIPFNQNKGWTVLIAVGVVGIAVAVMLV